jgi:hypothetical protein
MQRDEKQAGVADSVVRVGMGGGTGSRVSAAGHLQAWNESTVQVFWACDCVKSLRQDVGDVTVCVVAGLRVKGVVEACDQCRASSTRN